MRLTLKRRKLKEEKVTIRGSVSIGATVSYTDKSVASPAVVIIMGSGKTDRDGNQRGFHTDFYKNLSEMFSENGFVSLRYDKRGTYATEGNFGTAGLSDLTEDAASVVRYARSLSYVDSERVIVCGHSEGTMIASLLAETEAVAGLLLLGGAGMCMRDALLYQNKLLAEEARVKKGPLGAILRLQTDERKLCAKVDALFQKCAETKKEKIFFGGAFINAKWIKEHDAYTSEDFAEMIKKSAIPALAVTGTADLSADHRRLDAFAEASNIETYAPQGVNHMLRTVDDDNSMLTVSKQYKRLAKQPIHSETKRIISDWLRGFWR